MGQGEGEIDMLGGLFLNRYPSYLPDFFAFAQGAKDEQLEDKVEIRI